MQTEGFVEGESQFADEAHRRYRGLVQTFRLIVREEGILSLYKAVAMNFVKGPVAVGVSFATHDLVLKSLNQVM